MYLFFYPKGKKFVVTLSVQMFPAAFFWDYNFCSFCCTCTCVIAECTHVHFPEALSSYDPSFGGQKSHFLKTLFPNLIFHPLQLQYY